MNKSSKIILSFLSFIILMSCNLEKEIELDLPTYEAQTVVECYLIPGQPMSLLLSRSNSYFDAFPTESEEFLEDILLHDATVEITYRDSTYTLSNGQYFDETFGKFYNYSLQNFEVPDDYNSEFNLKIETPSGEIITSSTFITRPISIDSINVEESPDTDTLFRVLTYAEDPQGEVNYLRRTLLYSEELIVDQDFVVDDELLESSTFAFGTGYDYVPGDTIINILTQVDESYYRFFNTLSFAVDANGNPFGQPSKISSNVLGDQNPIGIFTGFLPDVRLTIID